MVYPPFYYVNLYEVLAFCFLSILSAMYLCTVTFLLFFPSLFVTFSDVLVRFSLFPVPYSFMIKIYVLGGPYLLCLDFMIYTFIGVNRCPLFISESPSDLSSGFTVFIFSYISIPIFPAYLPADLLCSLPLELRLPLVRTALAIFRS